MALPKPKEKESQMSALTRSTRSLRGLEILVNETISKPLENHLTALKMQEMTLKDKQLATSPT